MVRPGPAAGLLHARRPSPLPPAGPGRLRVRVGQLQRPSLARHAVVIIVDDDPRIREFVRVNLEMDGYVVREAGSADEGLAALEEQAPDLILLDVMMPGVDGWEMLRRMQERHGMGSIPVIMFSGQAENSDDDAQARGAQGIPGQALQPARSDHPHQGTAARVRLARALLTPSKRPATITATAAINEIQMP